MAMQSLLNAILKKITPTKKEMILQQKLAERLIKQIMEMEGPHIDVQLCGSIARETHLRGDNDLDLFVLFPKILNQLQYLIVFLVWD